MSKLQVGQIVYAPAEGNRRSSSGVVPFTVTKVGRIYFHVGRQCEGMNGFYDETRFRLEDNLEEVNIGDPRRVNFSEQEYLDEQECLRLFNQLRKCFDWRNERQYTLDQLRQVCRILKIEEGEH